MTQTQTQNETDSSTQPPTSPATAGTVLPTLGEELGFLSLLWSIEHGMRLASVRLATQTGLSWPHQLVIRLLGRFPGLAPGHLAKLLHLHPSSVSATLRFLGRRGLVRRWPDPRDRRRVLLGLTPAGRALDVPVADGIEAVVTRALRRQPESRVHSARELLEEMVDALGTAHGA